MQEKFDRKFIGNEIRTARKNKKLSQFELAELTGVDEKQIYRIESGITSPKLEVFIKIAEVLNLKIKYFNSVNISTKSFVRQILEILDNASEEKIEIYYNVLKSLDDSLPEKLYSHELKRVNE